MLWLTSNRPSPSLPPYFPVSVFIYISISLTFTLSPSFPPLFSLFFSYSVFHSIDPFSSSSLPVPFLLLVPGISLAPHCSTIKMSVRESVVRRDKEYNERCMEMARQAAIRGLRRRCRQAQPLECTCRAHLNDGNEPLLRIISPTFSLLANYQRRTEPQRDYRLHPLLRRLLPPPAQIRFLFCATFHTDTTDMVRGNHPAGNLTQTVRLKMRNGRLTTLISSENDSKRRVHPCLGVEANLCDNSMVTFM